MGGRERVLTLREEALQIYREQFEARKANLAPCNFNAHLDIYEAGFINGMRLMLKTIEAPGFNSSFPTPYLSNEELQAIKDGFEPFYGSSKQNVD